MHTQVMGASYSLSTRSHISVIYQVKEAMRSPSLDIFFVRHHASAFLPMGYVVFAVLRDR